MHGQLLHTLNYAMVEIHAPKHSPEISLLRDNSRDRLYFKAAFHVLCGLLEKKIYSTENNKITIGYTMLLCRGLVLLTAVKFYLGFVS